MGPDFLILENARDHPPAQAEINLRIDDSESTWRVFLAEGIVANQRKTPITSVPTMPPAN